MHFSVILTLALVSLGVACGGRSNKKVETDPRKDKTETKEGTAEESFGQETGETGGDSFGQGGGAEAGFGGQADSGFGGQADSGFDGLSQEDSEDTGQTATGAQTAGATGAQDPLSQRRVGGGIDPSLAPGSMPTVRGLGAAGGMMAPGGTNLASSLANLISGDSDGTAFFQHLMLALQGGFRGMPQRFPGGGAFSGSPSFSQGLNSFSSRRGGRSQFGRDGTQSRWDTSNGRQSGFTSQDASGSSFQGGSSTSSDSFFDSP